ncbi:MAG: hypothetical protein EON86_16040 [Brevundimonas sp.]|nr:MAG: hypothetical protein EON86_16040 [Brevundimonas sp.]
MTCSRALILTTILMLGACDRQTVNPPTEPADPIAASEVAPAAPTPPGVAPSLPGAGPESFVGRWAAQAAWCRNTTGPQRPITITPLRIEGYENSCAITTLDQVVDGYEVALACQSEGATTAERMRLSVQDDVLRLTWLNRNDAVVLLKRCAAEAVTQPPG